MNTRAVSTRAVIGSLVVGLACVVAQAQKGIGVPAPPSRIPTGTSATLQPDFRPNRFMVFVFANPMPGKDAEFDDWYQNQHVPDLLEHPGYYAAQRYRLVEPGSFSHSRLVIWHVEGDRELSQRYVSEALQTGKTRRSDAFNWTPGAGLGGTYEPISERRTNPAGGPALSSLQAGKKRYVFFEFVSPSSGKENLFSAQADRRLKDVVTVPGWVAGQRYKNVAPPPAPGATPTAGSAPASGAARLPRFLTIYDVETADPKAALEALTKAEQAGKVRVNTTVDPGTQAFFLEPISPFIKKEDWHPELVTK